MNRKTSLVLAWTLVSAPLQAQSFSWVRPAGGTLNDYAWSVSVDGAGNAYAAGVFQGTISFGAVACPALTSAGGNDAFFAKYDPTGKCLWARRVGGAGYDGATDVHADAGGRVYVTGFFTGTASFGSTTLAGAFFDGFLARIDPASGGVLWVRGASGSQDAYTHGVATDFFGNAYVTGRFSGTATLGTTVLVSAGAQDVFVAAYNQGGVLLWARRAGGPADDLGLAIAADQPGGAYVVGSYGATASFGSLPPLAAAGPGGDAFLAKYDLGGTALWAQKAGAASSAVAEGVAVIPQASLTASPHVFLSGTLVGSAAFTSAGGGVTPVASSSVARGFVADYGAGGVAQWVRTSTNARPRAAAADAAGTLYVAGDLAGPATFAGSGSSLSLPLAASQQDVFAAAYGPTGDPLWARAAGGASGDSGLGVAAGPGGSVWIAGQFTAPSATWGTIVVAAQGVNPYADAFVARLGCSALPSGGNLVGWWNGTPGVNTAVPDLSGKGNHGTLSGGANYGPGKVGQALALGLGAAVIAPDAPSLNFGSAVAGGDFSVDFWMRVAPNFASAGLRTVVRKRQPTPARGYHVALLNGSPVLELADGSGSTQYASNIPSLADGTWHFVGVSVKRLALNGIRWYVDGAPAGTVSNPLNRPGTLTNTSMLWIGLPGFDGSLDEIEIFNRALTPAEMAAIHAAGSYGKCP